MIEYDKYRKNGAYHFDWYDDPNYAWYKECVDRIIGFCKEATIDAGCGDGLVLSKLPKLSVGIDNDFTAMSICMDKGYDVVPHDLNKPEELNYIDFEYLCSLNTIEHLKTAEGLKQLVRQVAKGAIIITDKATEHKGRYHEHEYTKEELLDTFKEFKPKYFEINSTEYGKPITFIGIEIIK
jgi:hypothetical protein